MGSTWRETLAIKANFMKLQFEDAGQGRSEGVGAPCAKLLEATSVITCLNKRKCFEILYVFNYIIIQFIKL